MSIGQFFLGLVTIIVATFVYRWQKLIDHETKQKEELRRLYAEYTAALTELRFAQPMLDDDDFAEKAKQFFGMEEREVGLYCLRDQVFLLAPDNVVTALDKCDEAFREWKISFNTNYSSFEEGRGIVRAKYENLLQSQGALLKEMKKDLASHTRFRRKAFVKTVVAKWSKQ